MNKQNIDNVDIQRSDELLTVAWADGERKSFHSAWLWDNCRCLKCRHPNGQKFTSINEFSADIKVVSAARKNGGLQLRFSTDNHSAQFDFAWLRNFPAKYILSQPILWGAESLAVADTSRDYVAASAGRRHLQGCNADRDVLLSTRKMVRNEDK